MNDLDKIQYVLKNIFEQDMETMYGNKKFKKIVTRCGHEEKCKDVEVKELSMAKHELHYSCILLKF